MGISKQIGWSPEANLYYKISQKFENLISITSKVVLVPPTPPLPIPTVIIGSQEWMTLNLDVANYQNGDVIPEVTDPTAWAALTTGAWCYYNNDPANGAIYGKLYNAYAVNDPRGLAPDGYHIPSIAEWTTLETTLGGEVVAGGPLKEAGTAHWNAPNTGATNSSGWTGLPGGYRFNSGPFFYINQSGHFWSSTEIDSLNVLAPYVVYNSDILLQGSNPKNAGSSIRCLKD